MDLTKKDDLIRQFEGYRSSILLGTIEMHSRIRIRNAYVTKVEEGHEKIHR